MNKRVNIALRYLRTNGMACEIPMDETVSWMEDRRSDGNSEASFVPVEPSVTRNEARMQDRRNLTADIHNVLTNLWLIRVGTGRGV